MRKIRDLDKINDQATTDENKFISITGILLMLVII